MATEDQNNKIQTTPRERYLLQSCARHTDIIGFASAIPAAIIATKLLRRMSVFRNPPWYAFVPAQLGVGLLTWGVVGCSYMGTVCWGYLDLIPDPSPIKDAIKHRQEAYASSAIPYRTLAIIQTFRKDIKLDIEDELDRISDEERHEIQAGLRIVADPETRIHEKLRSTVNQYVDVRKYEKDIARRSLGSLQALGDNYKRNIDEKITDLGGKRPK